MARHRDACETHDDCHCANHMRKAERGNSLGYTLDRLKREHEELFKLVKAGELSAHSAGLVAPMPPCMQQGSLPDRLIRGLPQPAAGLKRRALGSTVLFWQANGCARRAGLLHCRTGSGWTNLLW